MKARRGTFGIWRPATPTTMYDLMRSVSSFQYCEPFFNASAAATPLRSKFVLNYVVESKKLLRKVIGIDNTLLLPQMVPSKAG